MTTSAYAVLGVCPESEDVVIRAAYRALMQKYTSLARLHEDFSADDRRAREVQAAYDAIEAARRDPEPAPEIPTPRTVPEPTPDLLFAPSPAPVEIAEAPAEPEPLAHAPRPRSGVAALIAVALVVGAGGAAAWWALRSKAPLDGAGRPTLQVRLRHGQAAAAPISRPLPCYVGGRSVGDLRLADCAKRNGVASGPLEVGLAPPLPAAAPVLVPVPPSVVVAAPAPPPPSPVTVSADASAGHALWRSAKAAALRFSARSLGEAFRAPRPAPRAAVRHRPEPARTALAKLDAEMSHPLQTLMRAVKAAPPEGVYAVQHFLEPPEPPEPPAPETRRAVQPSPPSADVLVPIAGRPAAP